MAVRCEAQQLSADSEPGFLGGFVVDLEADFIVLNREINHPARFEEMVCFADRQDAGIVEIAQDLWQAVLHRRAYEKNVAMSRFFSRVELTEFEMAIVYGLVADGFFQVISKDVFAKDTNDDG